MYALIVCRRLFEEGINFDMSVVDEFVEFDVAPDDQEKFDEIVEYAKSRMRVLENQKTRRQLARMRTEIRQLRQIQRELKFFQMEEQRCFWTGF